MFVYAIVNRESLKLYIGKTVGTSLSLYLKRKVRDALKGTYQGRSHLFAAMQKHPSSVWSIYPLVSGLKTNEELCCWEKTLIAALGTTHPEVGYNISQGGEGNRAKRTIEARLKISEASKRHWADPEQRRAQIERMHGVKRRHLKQLEANRRMWANPEKKGAILASKGAKYGRHTWRQD